MRQMLLITGCCVLYRQAFPTKDCIVDGRCDTRALDTLAVAVYKDAPRSILPPPPRSNDLLLKFSRSD